MTDTQIVRELDFIKKNFQLLGEKEKRSLWANLSEQCESIALEIAKNKVVG